MNILNDPETSRGDRGAILLMWILLLPLFCTGWILGFLLDLSPWGVKKGE